MRLRQLELKDAVGMYEWMSDERSKDCFHFDLSHVTVANAEKFITESIELARRNVSYHYAVVDDNDEYLGTISLEKIDLQAKTAAYAISMRYGVTGTGVAQKATEEILEIAFEKMNLNKVYLNVLADNVRAIKLYEKIGFVFEGEFRQHWIINGKIKSLRWYGMLRDEYFHKNGGTAWKKS